MGELRLKVVVYMPILRSDIYNIIQYPSLLPTTHVGPASYPKGKIRTLPDNQKSTVNDICDFIIEYINSDVLVRFALSLSSSGNDFCIKGLLSVRHLIIAGEILSVEHVSLF
jgi:hypothetical protein